MTGLVLYAAFLLVFAAGCIAGGWALRGLYERYKAEMAETSEPEATDDH